MIAAVALLLVVVAAIQVWRRPKPPLRLADTIQSGRSPWAARQDQRAATPPKRGWGGGFSYDQRRRIKQTTRRLAPVLCLVLVCCTSAQQAAGKIGAKAALTFVGCEAERALPQLGAWVGARLGDSQWQETGGQLLTGQISQAMACALRSLALSIPSVDARPTMPELQRLQTLAEQCPGGACEDVRLRAAWLLWREYHEGRLRLPPSGQG